MNRIFIAGENRLFSLNFPFKIYYEDAIYSVFTKSGIQLDSKNTSDIISLFSNPYFLNINPDSSFDTVIDVCANDSSSWNIFKDTLLSEAGYIRFDHDSTNENGTLHPLNHFDICYSTEATYKIGINSHVKWLYLKDGGIAPRQKNGHTKQSRYAHQGSLCFPTKEKKRTPCGEIVNWLA